MSKSMTHSSAPCSLTGLLFCALGALIGWGVFGLVVWVVVEVAK